MHMLISCTVCSLRIAITNAYGPCTCLDCSDFFYENVYYLKLPRCRENAMCLILEENSCAACRLNKCYNVGMKSDCIYRLEIYNNIRLYRLGKTRKKTKFCKLLDEKNLFEYFPHLFVSFARNISFINAFKILPNCDKGFLRRVCMKRGIIMELVEKCYYTHDVLRLEKCFIDPHVSRSEFVRDFGREILNFIRALKNHIHNSIDFYLIKFILIFDDYTNLWISSFDLFSSYIVKTSRRLEKLLSDFEYELGNIAEEIRFRHYSRLYVNRKFADHINRETPPFHFICNNQEKSADTTLR
ncbi:uncharacterized protein [Centruroides vittatus]|uniref:uncharacterized protein n=1 Tax=Centruroides vittatus TaxID=120091 RepID=UPI00351025B4